jgi:hypothetical protein
VFEDFSKAELCIGERCGADRDSRRRLSAAGARLCKGCRERLEEELGDLPRAYHGLADVMQPSPQQPFLQIKGMRTASGISIDEDASTGRSEILGLLRSWSALVADECSVPKPASHDCAAMTSFLRKHLDWLLAHPAAGDFTDEVHAVSISLRKIINCPPTQLDIGPCVWPGCDDRLFAMVSATSGKYEVHCGRGHIWRADQWLQLYRRLQGA